MDYKIEKHLTALDRVCEDKRSIKKQTETEHSATLISLWCCSYSDPECFKWYQVKMFYIDADLLWFSTIFI